MLISLADFILKISHCSTPDSSQLTSGCHSDPQKLPQGVVTTTSQCTTLCKRPMQYSTRWLDSLQVNCFSYMGSHVPRIKYDWAQSNMLFHFYNYRVPIKPVDFSLSVEEKPKASKRLSPKPRYCLQVCCDRTD